MEDTKYQKLAALCLVPPRLGLSLIFQQKPRMYLLLSTAHQFFSSQVLPALRSSVFHWLYLLISQFLIWCIWPLSPFDFSLSSLLFLGCSSFPGGWLTPAASLWCRTLPFRSSALAAGICTLSIPICNKLSFQLLPIIVPTPRWFLILKAILLLG